MRHSNKVAGSGLFIVVLMSALTACSSLGDLTFSNESDTDVTISTGADEVAIPSDGAASILGTGCSRGDVVVKFASGKKLVVSGPVCPSDQIVVHDGKVDVRSP